MKKETLRQQYIDACEELSKIPLGTFDYARQAGTCKVLQIRLEHWEREKRQMRRAFLIAALLGAAMVAGFIYCAFFQ